MSVFVTGTDTGVGKTSFTVALLRALGARGVKAAGYKPICCGDRDDAVRLHAASCAGLTIEQVNPVWLQTPAAPFTAARVEKREIDLALLRAGFDELTARADFVAVEGVGGWMVPITADYFSNDLAADLGLPVTRRGAKPARMFESHAADGPRHRKRRSAVCRRGVEQLRSGSRCGHGDER